MKRAAHGLAAAAYLAVALWTLRVVLAGPAELLPYPADHEADPGYKLISQLDQINEASATLRNAHVLLHAPSHLLDGDCYPIPRAVTFGEHMFAEGLAAVVPYAATGEPILVFNFVVVLWLTLAGISMYALTWHWTRNAGAAFVAGLLFEILPMRLGDPHHPFCHADHWTPLVLLFLHRLILRARWRDAAALAIAGSLQFLESAYSILEFALVMGVCAPALLAHHWRRLPALLPKLAAAAAVTATVAVSALEPFARTRAIWPASGRVSMPIPLHGILPGGSMYPGTVAVVLATVALIDRIRHHAVHDDPRLAVLTAGLVCAWAATGGLPVPVVGGATSALFVWVWRAIGPALEGLRGLALVAHGALLATSCLAAWGVAALTRPLPRTGRSAVVAIVAVAALLEVFHPDVARSSFGRTLEMRAVDKRPLDSERALYRRMVDGPVLDVPFAPGNLRNTFVYLPHYAALRMYHQHRIAACGASLGGPAERDVAALAARLPDPRSADALYAIGFRNVVRHEEFEDEPAPARLRAGRWLAGADGRLVSIGRAGSHEVFALTSPTPVMASLGVLERNPGPVAQVRVSGSQAAIPLTVRNRSASTYRHPDPVEPTTVAVRWRSLGGEAVSMYDTRLLLPIALAAGEQQTRTATVRLPGPGRYEVTFELAAPERQLLGIVLVDVVPPGETR